VRRDLDRLRQLQSFRRCAAGQCAGSRRSIFDDSGAAPALGSIAISRRLHFRARATRALLTRWCSRFLRAAVLSAFLAAADPMRAERKTFEIRGHYLPV